MPKYSKEALVNALEALAQATAKGVFTRGERKLVLADLQSGQLTDTVRSMLTGRKGFSRENGELAEIMEFFKEEEN